MVELVEAVNLLSRNHHIVEGEVINEPVFHPPQNIRLVEGAPRSDGDVLSCRSRNVMRMPKKVQNKLTMGEDVAWNDAIP